MKTILGILAICAATMMCGCVTQVVEDEQDDCAHKWGGAGSSVVNDALSSAFEGLNKSKTPTPIPTVKPTPSQIENVINSHSPDRSYSIHTSSGKDVYVCSHYGCDMAESLIDSGYDAGVVVDHADLHALTWVCLNDIRYVIEPQTGEYWTASEYEPNHNVDYVSLSKGREHAKQSSEGLHT